MNKIKLCPRLSMVAAMVRESTRLADVGTDHGYLIANLTYEGKIKGGVACDINLKPLQSAMGYIESLGIGDKVSCVLSDGLSEIGPHIVEDISIAGMGGDLISRIILDCPWAKDPSKSYVLQPMSKAEVLRSQLCGQGFELMEERAVSSAGKVYTVMRWQYTGEPCEPTELFIFTGRVAEFYNQDTGAYLDHVARYITKKAEGVHRTDPVEAKRYFALVDEIKALIL